MKSTITMLEALIAVLFVALLIILIFISFRSNFITAAIYNIRQALNLNV
jgi:hypothetical protein